MVCVWGLLLQNLPPLESYVPPLEYLKVTINPLTTIVQKSILPLRDRNRAYMHGFQRIRSNVFLINKKKLTT